jgi:ubiquinone/menaquinone biosynthesis C-methylase UbiE
MVELALARGIAARLGDVQALPFADGTFDTAVAAWMLYHIPDLDRGLAELARVLHSAGRLVAVTNGVDHLAELRAVFGRDVVSSFTRENGEEALQRHFSRVEQRDLDGHLTITEAAAILPYHDSMMTTEKDRELVFDLPLEVHTATTIFVATR